VEIRHDRKDSDSCRPEHNPSPPEYAPSNSKAVIQSNSSSTQSIVDGVNQMYNIAASLFSSANYANRQLLQMILDGCERVLTNSTSSTQTLDDGVNQIISIANSLNHDVSLAASQGLDQIRAGCLQICPPR